MTYKRPFTWSYSALSSFEQCGKQFYHMRIAKDFKEEGTNMAAEYGSMAHKAFELRLKDNKPLPMDLAHHDKFLQKLEQAPGDLLTEQKIALNRDFQPTGFFDTDTWLRGIVDLLIINGDKALVCDYKFGKIKDDFSQIRLTCAMIAAMKPEVKSFTGFFYWGKDKKITTIKLNKRDLMDVWSEFIPRVNRMEKAFKESDFPARESGLCKRYCAVTSCVHNGRY